MHKHAATSQAALTVSPRCRASTARDAAPRTATAAQAPRPGQFSRKGVAATRVLPDRRTGLGGGYVAVTQGGIGRMATPADGAARAVGGRPRETRSLSCGKRQAKCLGKTPSFDLSVMLWTVFSDLPFEQRLAKVAEAGYNQVELVGEYRDWTDADFAAPTPPASASASVRRHRRLASSPGQPIPPRSVSRRPYPRPQAHGNSLHPGDDCARGKRGSRADAPAAA